MKNWHRVIEAETIPLSAICSKNNVQDFTLVCDIEGAEIDILLCDSKGLQSCRQIFIELHNTAYKGKEYSPKMMKELLQLQYGFDLVCQDGNVYHFKKKKTILRSTIKKIIIKVTVHPGDRARRRGG